MRKSLAVISVLAGLANVVDAINITFNFEDDTSFATRLEGKVTSVTVADLKSLVSKKKKIPLGQVEIRDLPGTLLSSAMRIKGKHAIELMVRISDSAHEGSKTDEE